MSEGNPGMPKKNNLLRVLYNIISIYIYTHSISKPYTVWGFNVNVKVFTRHHRKKKQIKQTNKNKDRLAVTIS